MTSRGGRGGGGGAQRTGLLDSNQDEGGDSDFDDSGDDGDYDDGGDRQRVAPDLALPKAKGRRMSAAAFRFV